MSLNLARKPFVNARPVVRTSRMLWIVGLALLVLNGFLYWWFFTGQGETETGLSEVAVELELEDERLRAANDELRAQNFGRLNAEVEFVNERIRERTFSWSQLFDRLAAILPREARLTDLTPQFESRERSTSGAEPAGVVLDLAGEARTDEALLALIDGMFAHPAFLEPNLKRESRNDAGVIAYSISVVYLPDERPDEPQGQIGAES